MNSEAFKSINYKFSRDIIPRSSLRDSSDFLENYISHGHDSFKDFLRVAWLNTSNLLGFDFDISLVDIDIDLEISHYFNNGDVLLLMSLPYSTSGSDLICFYIRDFYSDGKFEVDISYYILYKTGHSDKYMLLSVKDDLSIKNLGYVLATENAIIKKIKNISKRQSSN